MAWYVLKNRRHVGPYQEFELVAMHRRQMISGEDFVISDQDVESGDLVYKRVAEVAHLEEVPDDPRAPAHAAHNGSDAPEKPLGSFSEEDLEKSQISRVFNDAVESVDLIKHPTPPGARPAGNRRGPEVTTVSGEEADYIGAAVNDDERSNVLAFFARYRALAIIAAVLGGAGFAGYRVFVQGKSGLFSAHPPGSPGARSPAVVPQPPERMPAVAPAGTIAPRVRVPTVRPDDPPPYVEPLPSGPPPPPPELNDREGEEIEEDPGNAPGRRKRNAPVPGAEGSEDPVSEEDDEHGDEDAEAANADAVPGNPAAESDNADGEDYE